MSFCLPTTHPSRQHDDKIARLYAEGLDDKQIARSIGIDPATVRRALRRLGLVEIETKPRAQLDEGLAPGNPIGCPDGTWCLYNADGPPLFWGSSEGAILSEVSGRIGSLDDAKRLMAGGARRWELLAAQAPALHRALTRKLKPTRPAPAPLPTPDPVASVTPATLPATPATASPTPSPTPPPVASVAPEAPRKVAEEAYAQRREASAARAEQLERAAERLAARTAQEQEAARERLEADRRRRAEQRAADKAIAAARKAEEAAARALVREAARQQRTAAIAAAREQRKHQRYKPAWYAQARALREAGHTLKEICAEVGRGETAVSRACEGIAPPPRAPQLAEEAAQVAALHQSGLTYRQIGEELGKSLDWVQRRMDVGRPDGYRAYRGGKPKLTPEQRGEIRQRYEAGESTYQLASAYGVKPITIGEAIRRAGGTLRDRRQEAAQDLEARAALLREMHTQGWTQRRMAQELGISETLVAARLRKLGLPTTSEQIRTRRAQQAAERAKDRARDIANIEENGYV